MSKLYTEEEVAHLLYCIFYDECACNYNGIDEWLPEVCECADDCLTTEHLKCWKQFLKHFDEDKLPWRIKE